MNDYDDLPEDRRDRFTEIVYHESQALSDVGEALATYLDKAEGAERLMTPIDEVEAFLDRRQHRIEEIEAAAAGLTERMVDPRPISRGQKAEAMARDELGDLINSVIAEQTEITTVAARKRAQAVLVEYAVGAILMPMDPFAQRARDLRYDVESLADAFSVQVQTVCHRLTALPAEADTPKFGYLRANAAGALIEMLGLPGLTVPRVRGGLSPVGPVPRATIAGSRDPSACAVSKRQPFCFRRPCPPVWPHRVRQTAPLSDRHAGHERRGFAPDSLCARSVIDH